MRPEAPFSFPSPVPLELLREEVQQIQAFQTTRALYDPGKDDHSAFSLRGYRTDPLYVESPMLEAVAAGGFVHPDPTQIVDTDAARDFPNCLKIADYIPGSSERVRIVRMGPMQIIPKHRDPHPKWDDRFLVRFHMGIFYPDECVFTVWDRKGQIYEICQPLGTVWYLDTNWPHMVVNGSLTEPRLNLCIDKFLDRDLRQWLEY